MPRYKGNVTQSILDWYAAEAMAAQQWFSQAAPNYWAFSLLNNATDGRRLWVYDAETVSGIAFPAGTGNPGGNPNSRAGYQGGGGAQVGYSFISTAAHDTFGAGFCDVPAPASIVAGNLIVVVMFGGMYAASFISPPDATWIKLVSIDGTANYPVVVAYGHIATGSEPATWRFTSSGSPALGFLGVSMQFAGNVNPVAIDAAAGAGSNAISLPIPAPAITLSSAGDLLLGVWNSFNAGSGALVGDSSFTVISTGSASSQRYWIGYKVAALSGPVGPFIGAQTPAVPWSALSIALKPSNVGAPPGQSLSAPIASVSPTQAGIVTLGFSLSPLGISGITRWIPPASHCEWHREAPLAVLQGGDQFNLAGISPENAAWGSLTWLAIK